ncbi:MAG: O-methyltransferase [Planctomycetota bacterium]
MSAQPTLVTRDHFRYLAERTRTDDALLSELLREAAASGIPKIQIAPAQASFMQILLKAIRARVVVEVGTLAGYSAIWMARALPAEGRLHTIEIERRHADFAERWIAKSDVKDRIQVHRGSGQDVLQTLPSESADAAFLDADKQSYPIYLAECLRIVRPRGLIMVDNAFAFGELFASEARDRETQAIRDFNDLVARTAGLHAVIVPLGDGLWVGVKD